MHTRTNRFQCNNIKVVKSATFLIEGHQEMIVYSEAITRVTQQLTDRSPLDFVDRVYEFPRHTIRVEES